MLIVFDLDGTLIDSKADLEISVNATRAHFGLTPLPQETISAYVGNGAAVLVRRALEPDATDERVAEALAFFLKYYRAHALEHTRLYDGIGELVEQLAKEGHAQAVLTNKPVRISADILKALKLSDHFLRILGGDSLPAKKPDPAGLLQLIADAGVHRSETLMVGDSSVDVHTSRNAAVQCCGVLWGFQPESFQLAKPDFLIAKPPELMGLVAQLSSIPV